MEDIYKKTYNDLEQILENLESELKSGDELKGVKSFIEDDSMNIIYKAQEIEKCMKNHLVANQIVNFDRFNGGTNTLF